MFLSANFWPLFWGLVGGGAALTALLSLLAALVRRPQQHSRQPLTVNDVPPDDREEAGRHLVAAGQK
jgi:hypothetical protein